MPFHPTPQKLLSVPKRRDLLCYAYALSGLQGEGVWVFWRSFCCVAVLLAISSSLLPAHAQWGSLNRNAPDKTYFGTPTETAEYHLKQLFTAYEARDFQKASAYFIPPERARIRKILSEPGGREKLIETANYPVKWEIGCTICQAVDACSSRVKVHMSKQPQKAQYYVWVLRPQANLWVTSRVDTLVADAYDAARKTCRGRKAESMKTQTVRPKTAGAQRAQMPIPKTWQEQARQVERQRDARSVDEFGMDDLDF